MTKINLTFKFVAVGAAIGLAMLVADMKLNSHATERTADHQTTRLEPGVSFGTNVIVGSDASTSTYGLDSTRSVDW